MLLARCYIVRVEKLFISFKYVCTICRADDAIELGNRRRGRIESTVTLIMMMMTMIFKLGMFSSHSEPCV